MYKVFFKDRILTLGEDCSGKHRKPGRLVYRYRNREGLKEVLDAFSCMDHVRRLHVYHEERRELDRALRSCFLCVEAGGGLVFNEKGEFLVILRKGVWDLPKGKLEKGEDFAAAALREVEEETGLQGLEAGPLICTTYHTYEGEGQTVLKETRWFGMHCKGKEAVSLQAEEGITEARWLRPEETDFIKQNTYRSIRDVLKAGGVLRAPRGNA
jgi:8-oxo-dGTP pyrophosphatase MutT (NUDIX family)